MNTVDLNHEYIDLKGKNSGRDRREIGGEVGLIKKNKWLQDYLKHINTIKTMIT